MGGRVVAFLAGMAFAFVGAAAVLYMMLVHPSAATATTTRGEAAIRIEDWRPGMSFSDAQAQAAAQGLPLVRDDTLRSALGGILTGPHPPRRHPDHRADRDALTRGFDIYAVRVPNVAGPWVWMAFCSDRLALARWQSDVYSATTAFRFLAGLASRPEEVRADVRESVSGMDLTLAWPTEAGRLEVTVNGYTGDVSVTAIYRAQQVTC